MKTGRVPMTLEEYNAHFWRLLEGDDGAPVTPPGTPLPHQRVEEEVAIESMWDLDDEPTRPLPRRWLLDEEAEDERCGRLIR